MTRPAAPEGPPLVSVIMAFHNGAAHLQDAAHSVLGQSHAHLELLLCDDASTDAAPDLARSLAARDGRVRVLRSATKSGPGAARNMGLEAARGDWIAVVDADDLLHPERISGLLAAAERMAADVVADDLVRFGTESGTTLLGPLSLRGPWRPDALELLRAERGTPRTPVGYLKPLIRSPSLATLRYRTDLPIGEDFDLLLRLALSGAAICVLPEPWYLYRRHAASTSHRLSAAQCDAILGAIDDLAAGWPGLPGEAAAELRDWRADIDRQRRFGDLVTDLKRRDIRRAAMHVMEAPGLWRDLARAAREGLARRLRGTARRTDRRPLVLAARPEPSLHGLPFPVPEDATAWDGARAAALARATGSGTRHLRAVGRPGLCALGHVPGWRLAELIPPEDGWTPAEAARIGALPWPVLHAERPADAVPGSPTDRERANAAPYRA